MNTVEKLYKKEIDGFSGNYKIFKLSTDDKNLEKFLKNHIDDTGIILNAIQKFMKDIIIIYNLNIDKNDQNKGHGSSLLKEILEIYNTKHAILACDITQNQRFGFILEHFYECHNFKTIETYQDFPLMLFPETIALNIINEIKKTN